MNSPQSTSPADLAPKGRMSTLWPLARYAAIALAAIGVGVALFYGIENWRGGRAWSAEREIVARDGQPLTWEALIPPAVPDDQNLAMAPPFHRLFEWQVDELGHPKNTNLALLQSWCQLDAVHGQPGLPGVGGWFGTVKSGQGRATDLVAWQTYFRAPARFASKHVVESRRQLGLPVPDPIPKDYPSRPKGGPPGYPLPEKPGRPAEDVLAALTVFESRIAAVAEATRPPKARFPIRYEDGPSALLPHLSVLKQTCTVLSLRALARLEEGQSEAALGDFRAALRLADAMGDEPLLISQLVRQAGLATALQPAWEGVVRGRWNESQLARMQEWLAAIDFEQSVRRVLAAERLVIQGVVHQALASGDGRREVAGMFDALSQMPDYSQGAPAWGGAYLLWAPRGWLFVGLTEISKALRTLESAAPADLAVLAGTWPPPPAGGAWRSMLYRVYLRASPDSNFADALLKVHRAHAQVRLAQTACALERYRLTEGRYPERLDALVPRWFATLPVDPMDGKPLRYARDGDDRFRLWSLGANARDDGGDRTLSRDVPLGSLDWVWSWPEEANPLQSPQEPEKDGP